MDVMYIIKVGKSLYSIAFQCVNVVYFNLVLLTIFEHYISFIQNLSTSPEVEPPYFEEHVRQALRFHLENPNVNETVFPQRKGHVFKKNAEGKWRRMEKI